MPGLDPVSVAGGTACGTFVARELIKAGKEFGLAAIGPWLDRRKGIEHAATIVRNAEARRQEKLLDEVTKSDIKAIRSGEKTLVMKDGEVIVEDSQLEAVHHDHEDGFASLIRISRNLNDLESLEKTLALREIVRLAEEEAEKLNYSFVPSGEIDKGWMANFRDHAQRSLDDQSIRLLWAKILIAEIESPGTQSLRTLNTLNLMSTSEARDFACLAPLVFNGAYVLIPSFMLTSITEREEAEEIREGFKHATFLQDRGLNIGKLRNLEAAGLLFTSSTVVTIDQLKSGDLSLWKISFLDKWLMIVENPKNKFPLRLQTYVLTQAGQQILKLGQFDPDRTYIDTFVNFLKHYQPDGISLYPVEISEGKYRKTGDKEVVLGNVKIDL